MTHSNEDLIRSLYEAREQGDLEAVRAMLADDIVWSEPDLDNPNTGNLHGSEAVLDMIRDAQRITGGTFRLVPHRGDSVHGRQVVAFIDWSAERDGRRIEGRGNRRLPGAGRQDSGGLFPRRRPRRRPGFLGVKAGRLAQRATFSRAVSSESSCAVWRASEAPWKRPGESSTQQLGS